MADEVVSLMQGLYFSEDSARAVLLRIEFPAWRIPAFRAATTFWPEVLLQLRNGAVRDGVDRLLRAALEDHPGNANIKGVLSTAALSVLCLLSDPSRSLRIDREARLFQALASDMGVKVRIQYAAQVGDIIRSIRNEKPRILHFGGHGTQDGRLLFEDESGKAVAVDLGALAAGVAAVTDGPLDCVVLNSCYSARAAAAFRGVTKAVVGAVTAVSDHCALAFADGLYAEFAAGSPSRKAFEAGRAEAAMRNCATWGLCYEPFDGMNGGGTR